MFFKVIQTTQIKNLRAQASEAGFYIVIILLKGERLQQSHQRLELGHIKQLLFIHYTDK